MIQLILRRQVNPVVLQQLIVRVFRDLFYCMKWNLLVDTLQKELRLLHRQLPNLSIAAMSVVEPSTTGVVTQVMNFNTHIQWGSKTFGDKTFRISEKLSEFLKKTTPKVFEPHCNLCDIRIVPADWFYRRIQSIFRPRSFWRLRLCTLRADPLSNLWRRRWFPLYFV